MARQSINHPGQLHAVKEKGLKQVEVAAGLIFSRRRILVCQRQEQGPFPLKWEFPGGKVEAGESSAAALRRELWEELGIEAGELVEILRYKHLYPGISEVDLHFFLVREFRGEVQNFAFRSLAWATVDELQTLDFLDGDLPVLRFLGSGPGAALFN